jgi:hypothetical protein
LQQQERNLLGPSAYSSTTSSSPSLLVILVLPPDFVAAKQEVVSSSYFVFFQELVVFVRFGNTIVLASASVLSLVFPIDNLYYFLIMIGGPFFYIS